MRKNKMLTLVFGLAILLSGVPVVQAGGFGPMHHKGGLPGLRALMELDLTDAQKTDVAEIIKKYRDEEVEIRTRLKDARENLMNAVHADVFNEQDVRQAFQQMSPLREDMTVLGAKFMDELKKVLTPEQLEKMKKCKKEFSGKMGKGMKFRRQMIDTYLKVDSE